ncbi:ribonuclease J [Lacticaseibacillus brantae]|uniref:Ribonuclease J n=1 Tax=Lacticaseibacillus brantae DSM 23927 TaxID=1423727 RepID=A0A0R2AYY3_9LACO|nr:ribonuclease J [Lacticaseibacillus brantae]KRM72561.1 metallo-beta-lactamase superfamily hydrolase [Lacticaseibacillus brantae DSM 23927]
MTKLNLVALGGVRENGKNMYAIEVDDQIFVADFGLKYPDNELLGIDIVIPDLTYLEDNADRIAGIFLSHGHADAIGALPYFLAEHPVPVFGSELTVALAKLVTANDPRSKKFKDFHVIDDKSVIDFGNVSVSFFKTTHSIPGSLGMTFETPVGQIVYTGDFKFDQSASPMYQTDLSRIAHIGDKKVLALLEDSANAEETQQTATEKAIYDYIDEAFKYHEGRIIVAGVASNIARIQQVLNAAAANGRKIVLTGKDVEKIVKTAIKLNYLVLPSEDLLVKAKDMKTLTPEETVLLETGRMGEPLKSLQKMATNRHRLVHISEGDLVFITTTTSHAMETMVAKTKDMIYRAGGEVKAISDDLKSSGHANKGDLQLMMNLLHPEYLIPVQGEYRQLDANAQAGVEVGIPESNIFIPGLGDILSYDNDKKILYAAGHVDAGNTMIDGIGVGDIGNIVLRDRKMLAEDGIFVAVVTIDRKKKKIVSTPKLTSRGFVYMKTSRDLIEESGELVTKTVQKNLDNKEFDWGHLKQDVRDELSHFLFDQTKRRPVILPVIMEVNQNSAKRQ